MLSSNDDYVYDYDAIKKSEIFCITLGSISILFHLSVIIILIWTYDILLKDKDLVLYILMIAICDLITSSAIASGFPNVHSLACQVQGFLFIFFSRF
jgi:hypothetical protein